MFALVAVDKAAFGFDKLFEYIVPEFLEDKVCEGKRVIVPFGRGNTTRQGMIFSLSKTPSDTSYDKYKSIKSVLDDNPAISKELLDLALYLANTTFCSIYDAIKAMLPPGSNFFPTYRYFYLSDDTKNPKEIEVLDYLKHRKKGADLKALAKNASASEDLLELMVNKGLLRKEEIIQRKIGDDSVKMAKLTEKALSFTKASEKQSSVISYLVDTGSQSLKEIEYYTGVSVSVIKTMEKNGLLEFFEAEAFRRPYKENIIKEDVLGLTLSSEQQVAFDGIKNLYDKKQYSVSLLYGVTGSGKTQVFIKLIESVLKDNKSVILMVPEISLTPQMIGKFISYFGSEVAVVHSALSQGERLDEWKRIKNQNAHIVIGTRSAVFSPVNNLGLIIMDEEQEQSYKSDKSPKYDARDVASKRAKDFGVPLVLASATPSIETFYKAKTGKINLFTMTKRYGNASLPSSFIVDMNEEIRSGNVNVFSKDLAEEIRKNLDNGEQTILLMNRRGYNTVLRCARCGAVIECPRCSIPLTYHKANGRCMCHYCGYSKLPDEVCPVCKSKYVMYQGCGTQKIEDELKNLFPNARILRMDLDTTVAKYSHDKAFEDFHDGKYDIMIGTQMVAKGLDFPKVTLVGVLAADMSLYSGDYRSYERTFGLLTQVIGRCGRSNLSGRAYIQTHSPENKVIRRACSQDYELFYKDEIINRKVMLYPPFCRMGSVMFSNAESSLASRAAESFSKLLQQMIGNSTIPIRILGPTPSRVPRVAGEYRWKLIIKYRPEKKFYELMGNALKEFSDKYKQYRNVTVNSDPYDIL